MRYTQIWQKWLYCTYFSTIC